MSFRTLKNPLTATLVALLVGYTVGCASAPPPKELVDARAAYIRAQSSPAGQLKPDSVYEAKVGLDKAERAYADDPNSQKARDIAYLALRRAELAEIEGRDAKAQQDKGLAQRELASLTQTQLSSARQQLASASERLTGTEQQLAAERAMREAAEKRAKEALDKLATTLAGSVKDEARGTVITVPGNVLFPSGKSTLLPGAQSRLEIIGQALKDVSDREIVVEGHTDAQGSDALNLKLSHERAQAVRDYLVAHGVSANRIRAIGLGETRPLADNNTQEGRAANRRVEIIVTPSQGTSGTERKPTTIDNPPSIESKPPSGGGAP